jgi:hypothetical protein
MGRVIRVGTFGDESVPRAERDARFMLDIMARRADLRRIRRVARVETPAKAQGANFDDLEQPRLSEAWPIATFKLGVDVCGSSGSVVFCNELLEVIQYTPKTPDVHAIPLVYVFSQVNRFYLGDLAGSSLFKLLDAGIQVFAVSWRNRRRNNATGGSTLTRKASSRRCRSPARSAVSPK